MQVSALVPGTEVITSGHASPERVIVPYRLRPDARLMSSIIRHLAGHRGQTTAEYGVVLGVVALTVVFVLALLSGTIASTFSRI